MSNSDSLYDVLEKHGIEPYIFSGIGPGWVPLVDQLITDMRATGWEGQIAQIKEKFGTLRFYYDTTNDCDHKLIDKLVSKAESESGTICETCGAPAKTRLINNYWFATICNTCLKDRKKEE